MHETICSCARCTRPITSDEAGMSKKLINRATTRFFCLDCLSGAFDVSTEYLQEMITYYKSTGCTLFVSYEE